MSAAGKVEGVPVARNLFKVNFGPLKKSSSARRFESKLGVLRRCLGEVHNRLAQQITVNMGMRLNGRVKEREFAKYLALTPRRVSNECEVPIRRRLHC